MTEPVAKVLDRLVVPLLSWNMACEPGKPKKARAVEEAALIRAVHMAAAALPLLAEKEPTLPLAALKGFTDA